jgi:hypothetical protein
MEEEVEYEEETVAVETKNTVWGDVKNFFKSKYAGYAGSAAAAAIVTHTSQPKKAPEPLF